MRTNATISQTRWKAIIVLKDGKKVDEFPLDEKEDHIRSFPRTQRRTFPKGLNSSTSKDKIKEIITDTKIASTLPLKSLQKLAIEEEKQNETKEELYQLPQNDILIKEIDEFQIDFNEEFMFDEEELFPQNFQNCLTSDFEL